MKRTLIGLAVATAAVASTIAAGGGTVAADGGQQRPTLAAVLLADAKYDDAAGFDRNWYDFDIVTQAVLLFPDLVEAASDPGAQLTAFLPNDAAFRRLVGDLTGTSPRTEADVFGAVASLGTDTVRTVLTYHLVAGPPIGYRAALRADGATLTTLQGATITVDVDRFVVPFVRLVDNDPDAKDPIVVWPQVGGTLSNGFAHGIDRVLRPIDL